MENNVDFDALNRKSNESGGAKEDLNNLFGATFALERWLFIARGRFLNINPYVAANPDYAGGQQMIRAFTDADRLQRFARENNLTDADSSTPMLEISTEKIVEYLERFISLGVHGVWFNSDTQSDGYFIPLKQLRPIKEHLAKIGWKSIDEPTNPDLPHNSGFVAPANAGQAKGGRAPRETVMIVVKDGLMLPSGFVKEADYFSDCFCRVPPEWTDGGDVTEAARQKLFETLYGKNWQAGNSDGSRYVVRRLNWKVLTAERAGNFDWNAAVDTDESHFLFFIADENDELKKVSREQFVADINPSAANFAADADSTTANNSPAQPAERVENVGDLDGYISWLRSGAIKFDQTFKPFFLALKPLLEIYAGAGEFTFAFAGGLDEPGMKDLFEDETSGARGAALKYRSCIYERGGKTEDLQVIGSNLLTHTPTGEKLRVQLTLRKDLAARTAKLIVVLLGTAAAVENLGAAIEPALDDGEFAKQLELKKPPSPEVAADLVG